MSGLETAIRQALERSDRTNAETRARIYQSARNALEAGLRKQDVHDPEVVSRQRHRLEAVIHEIETEERSALKVTAPQVPSVETPPIPAQTEQPQRDFAPELDDGAHLPPDRSADRADRRETDGGLAGVRPDRREFERSPQAEPIADIAPRRGKEIRAKAPAKPKRRGRGRFLSFLMVVAVLVAAFGTAAWWAESSGLLKSPAERNTGVANPPATTRAEDFNGEAGLQTLGTQSGFTGDWIEVFDPADPAGATAGSRASADPVTDDAGARLRIVSSSPDAEGNVSIEIPVAALQQISGKSSTVALSVQAAGGKPTQFSVECDFGSAGNCGRHRFTVHDEKNDMLFKVDLENGGSPATSGRILINSDVAGAGNPLNLYAVRLLPGQ